jgi:hypothetical protein
LTAPNVTTINVRTVRELAARLNDRGTSPAIAQQLAELQLTEMQEECRLAGRVIVAMLRQVHSSDVFVLPPD